MTDIGTLSVNVLAGLVLLGWWLAAHPGIAVLALLAASGVRRHGGNHRRGVYSRELPDYQP